MISTQEIIRVQRIVDTTPKKVCQHHTLLLLALFVEGETKAARYAEDLMEEDWRFYAVDQRRGYCWHNRRIITIPVWAWTEDKTKPGYLNWYLSHECAHAMAGHVPYDDHGPKFMTALKSLCEEQNLHYELGYKPRNALAAGILPEDF